MFVGREVGGVFYPWFDGFRYGWYIHDAACQCENEWAHTEGNSQLNQCMDVATASWPWVKKFKKRSVTELEIRQAIFQTKIPNNNMLAMLKGKSSSITLPEEESCNTSSDAGSHKMVALKEEVRKNIRDVREYSMPNEVIDACTEALKAMVERMFPLGRTPTKLESQRNEMDNYMQNLREMFVGRSALVFKLKNLATNSNNTPVLLTVCSMREDDHD